MAKYISYITFLCCLACLISSCSDPVASTYQPLEEYDTNIEKATDVITFYSDEGIVRVKVSAPKLERHKGKKNPLTIFPEGLDVVFFDSNHRESSHLVADYAERDEKEQKVTIRNNVVVTTKKNETIETDELIWDEKNQKVVSKVLTKITTENEEIECYGFEANNDFSEYETGKLKGIKKIKKQQFDQ